jgi:FKBP-type peptidyl-prolyl cis-trans isomerase
MTTSLTARFAVAFLVAGLTFGATAQEGAGEAALPSMSEQASYGIGYQIGANMHQQQLEVDLDAILEGFRAGVTGAEPRFEAAELQKALEDFQKEFAAAQQAKAEAAAAAAVTAGESFRAENAQREGVTVLPSGLQLEILEAGTGAQPTDADQVVVHYKGTLPDGTVFDSSYDRGQPATFPVTGVIAGFSEGLRTMQAGGKYRLVIPPDIGYGERGAGPIPANSTLVFEVELVDVVSAEAPAAEAPAEEEEAPAETPEEGTGDEGPGEG